MSKRYKNMKSNSPDNFQTPGHALDCLLPHVPKRWKIWKPAFGNGNLLKHLNTLGYCVIGTDIIDGCDFMNPKHIANRFADIDCIITNPPYSIKDAWIARCFELGKPFALLLPVSVFDSRRRREMFQKHRIELIFPDGRINFETPNHTERAAVGKKSASWFYTFWLTHGLKIGRQLTFTEKK